MLLDPWVTTMYGSESPLAYYPQSGSLLTNQMDFGQRMQNTITYYVNLAIFELVFTAASNKQRKEFGIALTDAQSRANVGILILQTSWVVEYPRPITPVMKAVGPILPEPGKPLLEVSGWIFA